MLANGDVHFVDGTSCWVGSILISNAEYVGVHKNSILVQSDQLLEPILGHPIICLPNPGRYETINGRIFCLSDGALKYKDVGEDQWRPQCMETKISDMFMTSACHALIFIGEKNSYVTTNGRSFSIMENFLPSSSSVYYRGCIYSSEDYVLTIHNINTGITRREASFSDGSVFLHRGRIYCGSWVRDGPSRWSLTDVGELAFDFETALLRRDPWEVSHDLRRWEQVNPSEFLIQEDGRGNVWELTDRQNVNLILCRPLWSIREHRWLTQQRREILRLVFLSIRRLDLTYLLFHLVAEFF